MTLSIALDRRRFLTGSTALGLAAGLSPVFPRDLAYAQAPPTQIPPAKWGELADKLTGPLLRQKDTPFDRFVAPYNLAYDKRELYASGIAMCVNSADVVASINWARDNKVPLVARSGGHSYAGYSMTNGLMIDLATFRGASWDAARQTVTVTGGARNSDVAAFLKAHNRTITHGRCPTVGTAGFLLGGGIGFNMRMHGVGSDHLRASEIATADGKLLPLAPKQNDDLFWAIRGCGGGNYGINTSFTIETHPAPPLTVFRYTWEGTRAEMAGIAYDLMNSLTHAPDEIGSRFSITAPNPVRGITKFGVNIIGQNRGTIDGTERTLRPAIQTARTRETHYLPYWPAQDFLLEASKPFYFRERSAFLTKPLTLEAFEQATEQLGKWLGTDDSAQRYAHEPQLADIRFFQTGGKINRVAAGATAFVHRDSVWLMDIGLPWTAEDPPERVDANIAWQNQFFEQMWPYSNRHAYQNFVDAALKDPMPAYYHTNLDRLRKIKRLHDPANLFNFPQSIPL